VSIGFYFDENTTDHRLLAPLRDLGVECVAALQLLPEGASDEAQLAQASALHLALVTADLKDFQRISAAWLRSGRNHGGIVFVRQRHAGVGEVARQLAAIALAESAETMANQVRYLRKALP
jgi:Domain of unknown function (DUF5615)